MTSEQRDVEKSFSLIKLLTFFLQRVSYWILSKNYLKKLPFKVGLTFEKCF